MSKKRKMEVENPRSKIEVAAPPPQAAIEKDADITKEEPSESVTHFFKPEDWIAGLLGALISGLFFFYYMAPEVTLQDSGELVTGAFTFGVPHPPGYPLWAFLGFIWSHFILPFGNPAWRIGMLSVVTGAFVVGVMTVTMTRSIRLLLHSLPWSESMEERLQHWIALTVALSTAFLFGFNRGVWLWACVSEMRVLNVFSFVLISCTFFAWTIQPYRRGFLYVSLFLFGLSMANHQTITVMAAPFAIGVLAVCMEQFVKVRNSPSAKGRWWTTFMTSLSSFWELTVAGLFSAMLGIMVFTWLRAPDATSMTRDPLWSTALAAGIAALAMLVLGHLTKWWKVGRALACTLLFLLGVSFYLYMPLASSTNPPMNWGYAATKAGFLHAVTRGQYEKIQTAQIFSEEFVLKIQVFVKALIGQYSLPLTLLALVTLVIFGLYWRRIKPHGRAWMVFVWAAFLATSFGLLTIINPKLDRQEQEITIKFFAPAHGFYAMLIGYGIAILLSLLAWRGPAGSRLAVRFLCIALLALPIITYKKNWSLCNLRGHDFGYLFGYLMFNPGEGYPEMERDAVLYGGTDPGRFVPTYMIFCESRVSPKNRFRDKNFDRSDVYIITQNALADNTYMSYIRDHYDYSRPKNDSWFQRLLKRDRTYPVQPIYIPSPDESNRAFQQYVQDVQSGKIPPSADISFANGRVSIQGVGGVMAINGILAQWIFERNKDKHAFYIEESYVIPWMYPYLRPHGVIMKIEKEPIPAPQEDPKRWSDIVARDRAYWDKLCGDFLARPDFRRNNDAKKSFSKMRSAIAGLYVFRGMVPEAEYAFKQSLQLCPESPEATFRLAELYTRLHRYSDARVLVEAYQKIDEYNKSSQNFLDMIKNNEADDVKRIELETMMTQGRMDISSAVDLAALYQRLNMEPQFRSLTQNILNSSNFPPQVYLTIAQLFKNGQRWDLLETALKRYNEFVPNTYQVWIELGFAQLNLNKAEETLQSFKLAVQLGGELARAQLRQDPRFQMLMPYPAFQALVPSLQPMDSTPLPFMR